MIGDLLTDLLSSNSQYFVRYIIKCLFLTDESEEWIVYVGNGLLGAG